MDELYVDPSISVTNIGKAFNVSLHLAPVVIRSPVVHEFLHRR